MFEWSSSCVASGGGGTTPQCYYPDLSPQIQDCPVLSPGADADKLEDNITAWVITLACQAWFSDGWPATEQKTVNEMILAKYGLELDYLAYSTLTRLRIAPPRPRPPRDAGNEEIVF